MTKNFWIAIFFLSVVLLGLAVIIGPSPVGWCCLIVAGIASFSVWRLA